ncbi:tRNA preQ1(34) S-adenosylmethionine ribosyltransferase-isomerase QueA [Patescibacteria group bacterium]|nr:tRNA preQ1(34) S-adenosylmethionine ribosyltransferase-isomerase QueA [Patescibacteria group bacterium]MBU1015798.1 tRNA preQ1(34) S-adenosylmethionine ribosyltransferase-isomerase QueA [Patescibacteria group bacterium]MBU1685556.1 tRNA preQ1(34) S-adenosylmethionine ribosyltransferase-isomerase QueA [Patescibacteria group bacterium]MBU1938955.1 tRNA preQ1(34) S-adenosylmethionine ribosyltransferase-isomerase QueA [Patescibacteria group bacterium]
MHLADFDYHLPKELIAQKPLAKRDQSKLMVLDRKTGSISHHQFFELPDLLESDSVMVFNESRVIPARFRFKLGNGMAEILLIKHVAGKTWECMVRPGPKFTPGTGIDLDNDLSLTVKNVTSHGLRTIEFECRDFDSYIKTHGRTPLPPYIKEPIDDPEQYQTVYAKTEGSVAAPTAGFHFTDSLFANLKEKGIQTEFITLHVSLGTFQPVKTEKIEEHKMHSEWFELSENIAKRLNKAKKDGRKIIAVGTTTVRVLETCTDKNGELCPHAGETDIFIFPGYKWKFVDELITNFHVPKSTLLMLVSSFAGREFILKTYEEARKKNYRFFSFGDSMYIK